MDGEMIYTNLEKEFHNDFFANMLLKQFLKILNGDKSYFANKESHTILKGAFVDTKKKSSIFDKIILRNDFKTYKVVLDRWESLLDNK